MAFKHDSIVPYQKDKSSKKEQVAKMFDQIAFRYDFINRLLTMGIDCQWRKKAIRQLKDRPVSNILDVATGTADLALLAYKILHPKKIIGIDISEGMLQLGRKKIEDQQLQQTIELQIGDSEAISFPNDYFDAVTVAFGVRNFANLEKGLVEMYRVLKPNGKLVILEFSQPKNRIFKALCNMYNCIIAPQAGRIFAKNKAAYQYLNQSIEAFPEGADFLRIMEAAGFQNTYRKSLSMGICTIYCGHK